MPRAGLVPGRPSGSAMPLVWAHAEFVKLAVGLREGRPVDRPEAVWLRYAGRKPRPGRAHWAPWMPVATIAEGQQLRVLCDTPTAVRWGVDGLRNASEAPTAPSVLGLHAADLATGALRPGQTVHFTSDAWPGQEWAVAVTEPDNG